MATSISAELFTRELYEVLEETFERTRGIYLDRATSLFETLETISAEMASHPVSANCASIAAQVEHVSFYLDVLEGHMLKKNMGKVDWDEIWSRVEKVTPEEWEASKNRLKETYQRVLKTMKGFASWEGEEAVAGSLAILAHTAYHLGEIRQALCTIRLLEVK